MHGTQIALNLDCGCALRQQLCEQALEVGGGQGRAAGAEKARLREHRAGMADREADQFREHGLVLVLVLDLELEFFGQQQLRAAGHHRHARLEAVAEHAVGQRPVGRQRAALETVGAACSTFSFATSTGRPYASNQVKAIGYDVVHCTSSGFDGAKIPVGPNYQVPLAEAVRKSADVHTAAVGLITKAQDAEQILENGRADLVALARQALDDPNWPLHAMRALGARAAAHPGGRGGSGRRVAGWPKDRRCARLRGSRPRPSRARRGRSVRAA